MKNFLFTLTALLLVFSTASAQEAWERIDVAENFGSRRNGACPGDFNGDGLVDIAAYNGRLMYWHENQENR